jgi:glycosyltransferase involved in cell wall biosynthesis
MGVPPSAVTVVGNGIDIDAFALRADKARGQRDELRQRLGVESALILSVGGKNVELVVAAAELIGENVSVVVVGTPGRDLHHPLVVSLGRRDSQEMPSLYAAADCVAHPTRLDRWPHAINEALSAGVPVVASRNTGVPDEIFAGPGSGLVDGTPTALAHAIDLAIHVDSSSPKIREEIRAPLRPWGIDGMTERILAAVERAIAG